METAPYRISLWHSKKRAVSLVRVLSEETPGGAVFCAQQWILWSQERKRGGLPKYDRYKVEARAKNGAWTTLTEGTLSDAETQSPATEEAETAVNSGHRRLIGRQGVTAREVWAPKSSKARPKSRLAALVEKTRDKQ